jgi:hypothetical protein
MGISCLGGASKAYTVAQVEDGGSEASASSLGAAQRDADAARDDFSAANEPRMEVNGAPTLSAPSSTQTAPARIA